ncbi:N-acetylmuramoyl-L-alanine amidase [bacterium]|nr:N-acetylmuramoyl-L-alanine amidase [bacterium]
MTHRKYQIHAVLLGIWGGMLPLAAPVQADPPPAMYAEAAPTDSVCSIALLSDSSALPYAKDVIEDRTFYWGQAGEALALREGAQGETLRLYLAVQPEFLASDDFDAAWADAAGRSLIREAESMKLRATRYILMVPDPKAGKWVDVQSLLEAEPVSEWNPPPDYATDKEATRLDKDPHRAAPTINPGWANGSLSGKTIYINQSHGWFDDFTWTGDRWRVQRSAAYGILEDFDSPEFIDMYVIPALRNAGAKVQTVREMDLQTNMVIVDNADAEYAETGSWYASSYNGFKHKTTASWEGVTINPFNQGSGENRLANITTGAATATATWTATIPADGYYNVYASWSAYSARAHDAQYLVYHSGGVTEIRMDQTIDGYTWNLLGNFYFEAGAPATERQVVLTNSSSDTGATNVSSDAVRWGGGMGDVARHTNGVSGRPRWEEEAVNYLQFNGFGYSGTLYSGDDDEAGGWSDRPQYARWEHSQKDGSVEDAIYFAWHTNASGDGSARGLTTYRHTNASAASETLQYLMHDKVYNAVEDLWIPGWTVRAKNVYGFSEINQDNLGSGLPGFLFEGLFHDNSSDAAAYAEPEFRHIMARAITHGAIDYFAQRDGYSAVYPPETPTDFRVESLGSGQARLRWSPPPSDLTNIHFGDQATGYKVQKSSNGFGFDDGAVVTGTELIVSGLSVNSATYFRVVATNAGGESFPTETLAASDGGASVLIVNGFDRNGSALVPRETITNAGTDLQRCDWRNFQAFDYAVEHASALAPTGVRISSASNEAVENSSVTLSDYAAVFWICGEESTADETFSSTEQSLVSSYMNAGGKALFVSGAEVAWDLANLGSAADQTFFANYLRATYVGDDAGTYQVSGTAGGPFASLGTMDFSVGAGARYDAQYPDRLGTTGGSIAALTYVGGTGGTAAVAYDGASDSIYLGFPFELIADAADREALMQDAVDFFGLAVVPTPTPSPSPTPSLTPSPTPSDTPTPTPSDTPTPTPSDTPTPTPSDTPSPTPSDTPTPTPSDTPTPTPSPTPATDNELIDDFETYTAGTQARFRDPDYSGSTAGINTSTDDASVIVTNSNAILDASIGTSDGSNAERVVFDLNSPTAGFVRLTTSNVTIGGNPEIRLDRGVSVYYKLTGGEIDMGLWIRESNSDGPTGDDGGGTGAVEEMDATVRLVPGDWHYAWFDVPNASWNAITGNGQLDGTWGVLEALTFRPAATNSTTNIEILIDDLYSGPEHTPLSLLPGDEDGDGFVTIQELNAVVIAFRGLAPAPASADTTPDGIITLSELNAVVVAYRASLN